MEGYTASAPGKLMIFGEHAVLYGYPCIVTAVDLRMRVGVKLNSGPSVEVKTDISPEPFILSREQIERRVDVPKEVSFVIVAVRRFWEHFNLAFGAEITTKSEFTYSYGLGSSSAVTVATIRALASAAKVEISKDTIFRLAYESVKEVQRGDASGFDVAAAVYGGLLYYVSGGSTIREIRSDSLPLVVCYSGTKASTVELVGKVRQLHRDRPMYVDEIMTEIGEIVNSGEAALLAADYPQLGRLMKRNQNLLAGLGVSTDVLDTLVDSALVGSAYGAKLSGAGGGDCIIAVSTAENRVATVDSLMSADVPNAKILEVATLAEGVRIEPN